MTDAQRSELADLEARDHLEPKEFDRYEFLKKAADADERAKAFIANQNRPYKDKVSRAANLAWEFYNKLEGKCFISVGGLDSITLLVFLRRWGIDCPAVSVSSLEDRSIQRVHKALGVTVLKPLKSKVSVLREFGWPVISKEIAGKIDLLQRPTPDNATVRHAIITGETGAAGVQYVRFRDSHGRAPSPIRPTMATESEGMGFLDEERRHTPGRHAVRMGPCAGLYRRKVARSAGSIRRRTGATHMVLKEEP